MMDIAAPDLPPALSVPFGLAQDSFRRLGNLVRDMDQAELEYTGPPGNVNSTATLLRHLAFVDLAYLHVIKGVPVPPDLEAAYGPYQNEAGLLPPVTGKTAAELMQEYRRVLDIGRDYLAAQTDAEAARPVKVPWWPQEASVRFVLWHMAGHSMFHQGQIRRLRQHYKQR